MEKQVTAVIAAAAIAPVAEWLASNEPLIKGFWAVEEGTYKYKIGDGLTTYANLPYADDKFLTPAIRAKIINYNTAGAFVQTDSYNEIPTNLLPSTVLKSTAVIGNPDDSTEIVAINTDPLTQEKSQVRLPLVKMSYYPLTADEISVIETVFAGYENEIFIDYTKPYGHCERYGLYSNGTIQNWESAQYGRRSSAFYQICATRHITGYVPKGIIYGGLNIAGSNLGGCAIDFDDVEIRGILHIMSSAIPNIADARVNEFFIGGKVRIADRLGITNVSEVHLNDVYLLNDPAINLSTPGVGGRGLHAYFGIKGLRINYLRVAGCVNGNNTDACISIDGAGKNPEDIWIKDCWIEDSDTHALYMTGNDHRIDKLRIDKWGRLGYAGSGMQDSNVTASNEVCAVWLNRVKRCKIGSTYIDNVSDNTRSSCKYPVRVTETGVATTDTIDFGEIVVSNMGGAATGSERGINFGDRNDNTNSKYVNVTVGRIEAKLSDTGALASGYAMVNINHTGPTTALNTRVTVVGDIQCINPSVETGVKVIAYSRLIHNGRIIYEAEAGKNARGTALDAQGEFVGVSGGTHSASGGSLTTSPAIWWRAQPGSVLGPWEGYAASPSTKTFLQITGANNTKVMGVSCDGYRSTATGAGTVLIEDTSNIDVSIGRIYGTATPVAATTGISLKGTLSNIAITGGNVDGFALGIGKYPTNSDFSASNITFNGTRIGSNNTQRTNLTSKDYSVIGEVDFGVTAYDTRKLVVSQLTGRDHWIGTEAYPKATVAGALTSATSPLEINLGVGTWNEATVLTLILNNLTILGVGFNNANASEINGNFIVNDPGSMTKIKNLNLNHAANVGMLINSSVSKVTLENIVFAGSETSVKTASTTRGFIDLIKCDFTSSMSPVGNIVLPDLPGGATAILRLVDCVYPRISIGIGWTVWVIDSYTIQILANSGTLIYAGNDLGFPYITKLLSSQAELTSLVASLDASLDGYYISNFDNPSIGSKGDILYKITVNGIATSVKLNRPFLNAPSTIFDNTTKLTYKREGVASWVEIPNPTTTITTISNALPTGGNDGDIWYHIP